jgi:hypothetical protein
MEVAMPVLALVVSPTVSHPWSQIAPPNVIWRPLPHAPADLDPDVQGCVVIPDRDRPLTAVPWLTALPVPVLIITDARRAAMALAQALPHGCLICPPHAALPRLPTLIAMLCGPITGTVILPDISAFHHEEMSHAAFTTVPPPGAAARWRLAAADAGHRPGM